jgi:cysteinyl-tRNA synthetase
MNITDVGHLVSDADDGEDKMELGAAREGRSAWDIAQYYTDQFRIDLADLNVIEPDIWCKATDHIQEQIEWIQKLEDLGYTYILEDGVYFDSSKFKDYGRLARLDVEGLKAGARVDMVAGKRRPTDFALWKFSPSDQQRQMEWDSPWGVGFPGWHIECSVMAVKYLGERIDIHCGGVDHVAVHHTNEIAQTESVTGEQWVNWWLHGEFLVLKTAVSDGPQKMAKSGGNFITLKTVMDKGYDPLVFRYFLLNAHYRAKLTFSWEALDSAATAFKRLKNRVLELKQEVDEDALPNQAYLASFKTAVDDDLNMPRALAVVWEMLKDDVMPPDEKVATLLQMDQVLGLGVADWQPEDAHTPPDILALVSERESARKRRDFAEADRIRDELVQLGYVVEDTPEGTRVSPH